MKSRDKVDILADLMVASKERNEARRLLSASVAREKALREALECIERNTCCQSCQEAALVARMALAQVPLAPKEAPRE